MANPEQLGPYQIESVIGRGGMGSVYRAKHGKTGEEVAVKLIAQHVADDMRFRRRFDAEIETLRRLRHPGIVRLIGYGEEAGQLFYSMEFVHGQTLQQRIRDVKRLGWLPTLEIATQVCSALKHAHDIGVIHRDLKPANLILTDGGEVKLVDFGIAKLFGFGEQTVHGSVLGTADYMAPEQAGSHKITPRTDLYALGSVMYAMLAGRAPFAGKKITQVVEALKRDRPVPLDLINPDLPAEVVEIVHHLLEKEPADRPPTALAVMNRLKATRAGLQRGKTLHDEVSRTTFGDEDVTPGLTPNPAASTDSDSSDTRGDQRTDASHGVSPDLPTDATGSDHRTGRRVFPGQGEQDNADQHSHLADPVMPSVAGTDAEQIPISQKTSSVQTSFQTVDSASNPGGYLSDLHRDEASDSQWVHWLSIAGMVAILIGGAFLFFQSIRTPSASTLYTAIETAEQNGTITLEKPRMQRFLSAYPDDERAAQVRQWQSAAELESTLRRLAGQARSAGGVSNLPPAEQAFLLAMNDRDVSLEIATQRLQAWLDVFSVPGNSADEDQDLTPAEKLKRRLKARQLDHLATSVREELERLRSAPTGEELGDERQRELRARMTAADQLDTETRLRVLTGIITLYEDQTWARPIVEEARAALKAK